MTPLRFPYWLLLISLPCCGSGGRAASEEIDPDALLRHAGAMVKYGPHPPGSQAQRKVRDYISGELRSYGLEVEIQEFEPVTPLGRLPMANIWARRTGGQAGTIILASHYDSKYFKEFAFVGANDGVSSSALLLELGRLLARGSPPDYSVWFVFFDGEEALVEWTSLDSLYGSREFVSLLKRRGVLKDVAALILLDLVGEKDLVLRRDSNSTAWLTDIIWEEAARLGYSSIFREGWIGAGDDHIPFAEAGVPVVDIIDLDYIYWHTEHDTLDKVHAPNLRIVGEVVLSALPKVVARRAGSGRLP